MSNYAPQLPDRTHQHRILDAFHHEHWHLTKLLVLLSIVAITSVGSFSLAQHVLPQGPIVTTTPTPTFSDGACDADPNQLQSQYIPLSPPSSSTNSTTPTVSAQPTTAPTPKSRKRPLSTASAGSAPPINALLSASRPQAPAGSAMPTPTVPSGWYTYGLTDADARYAEACAAQFVLDYHTFDYTNLASLETPAYMLSARAKQLFYLGGADDTHNLHLHMLSTWRDTIQEREQSQQATIAQPTLTNITPQYSNYIVDVDVGYKLIKEVNSEVQAPEFFHDTVILQNTSPSPKLPNEQHGWEVVDWIDADA
jgi:hypothetical protein